LSSLFAPELKEPNSPRAYLCNRCRTRVIICRLCDRGHRYCRTCAPIARAEAAKRAKARYEKSLKGRERNRCRQKRSRQRKRPAHGLSAGEVVCEHALPAPAPKDQSVESCASAHVEPMPAAAVLDLTENRRQDACQQSRDESSKPSVTHSSSLPWIGHEIVHTSAKERRHRQSKPNEQRHEVQCDMCGLWCSAFVRRKPWHRGRRYSKRQGDFP